MPQESDTIPSLPISVQFWSHLLWPFKYKAPGLSLCQVHSVPSWHFSPSSPWPGPPPPAGCGWGSFAQPSTFLQTQAGASHGLSQKGYAGSFFIWRASKPTELQKRLETPSVSSSSSWWGTGYSPGSCGPMRYFWASTFWQFAVIQGFWLWWAAAFCSLLLLSILGFVLSNDLIFQVQWPLMALVLLSTTENVAAEVCGEFYLQSFFQSKSTNNSSFSSSLASIWPRAASSTWNLRKPHSKRSYLYIHWVAGKGLAKGLLLVHTSAKNKECLEHFPLPLALDY